MPVCVEESVGRLWRREREGGSSGPPSPSATLTLLDRRYLTPKPPPPTPPPPPPPTPPISSSPFLLRFTRNLLFTLLYLTWTQFILLAPAIWLSACLWIFWKCVEAPIQLLRWLLTFLFIPTRRLVRRKRTVLLSGGSSIQSLHLARNFYSAGARVVVFEVEGLFGLARFSAAVDKFYTVPKPSGERAEEYMEAVKSIVTAEKASFYVPTCVSSTAYYEAMLKPHLELSGCTVFCPGLKEVSVLDDPYELLRRCRNEGLPVPDFYRVSSKEDINRLYEDGTLGYGRHMMLSVGSYGCRERSKLLLPKSRREFKCPSKMSPQRPWLIIKDYPGDHFVTCTTVKDSQVVANITCRVEEEGGKLVPVEHKEIEIWITQLFSKLRFLRPISGQMSFRLVESSCWGSVVPMGCRVGVSLPYICHTSAHARIIWKPCRHFTAEASGPLVAAAGRYWIHEAVIETLKRPSVGRVGKLIGTVLDRREALFSYWDPLPYCAYYHIQLPFNNVLRFVQGQNGRHHGLHSPLFTPTRH